MRFRHGVCYCDTHHRKVYAGTCPDCDLDKRGPGKEPRPLPDIQESPDPMPTTPMRDDVYWDNA